MFPSMTTLMHSPGEDFHILTGKLSKWLQWRTNQKARIYNLLAEGSFPLSPERGATPKCRIRDREAAEASKSRKGDENMSQQCVSTSCCREPASIILNALTQSTFTLS